MNSDSSWASQSNGGLSAPSARHSAWLQLYLYACKLLDLAIALPADELPQFQMYRWAFVGDPFDDTASAATPHAAAATPEPGKSGLAPPGHPGDRLSLHSLNNNNASESRLSMKSPAPSPTPSRTSFGSKSQVCVSPVLPVPSGPFEPHVVRIERTMKLKVRSCCFTPFSCICLTIVAFAVLWLQNPNPDLLTYSERKPLLWLTSIKSLLDLHPFFHTLVRVTNNTNLTKSTPDTEKVPNGGPTSGDGRQPRPLSQIKPTPEEEDPLCAQDRNLDSDFLEDIPWI